MKIVTIAANSDDSVNRSPVFCLNIAKQMTPSIPPPKWTEIYKTLLSLSYTKKKEREKSGECAALPRHQEEEETDKTKQAEIKQTYEKH